MLKQCFTTQFNVKTLSLGGAGPRPCSPLIVAAARGPMEHSELAGALAAACGPGLGVEGASGPNCISEARSLGGGRDPAEPPGTLTQTGLQRLARGKVLHTGLGGEPGKDARGTSQGYAGGLFGGWIGG